MTDLRTYMSSEYFSDNQIVAELDAALLEVSKTFEKTFDQDKKSWPYGVSELDPHLLRLTIAKHNRYGFVCGIGDARQLASGLRSHRIGRTSNCQKTCVLV